MRTSRQWYQPTYFTVSRGGHKTCGHRHKSLRQALRCKGKVKGQAVVLYTATGATVLDAGFAFKGKIRITNPQNPEQSVRIEDFTTARMPNYRVWRKLLELFEPPEPDNSWIKEGF